MMSKKWRLLVLLILCAAFVYAQDSTIYRGKAGVEDVREEDPGLFIVMMIVLVGLITSIILGLITLTCLFFGLMALVTGGILSFSVIVGVYRGSLLTGVRTFIFIIAMLLGGAAGTAGYILFSFIRQSHFQFQYMLFLSTLGGMAGGLSGGWFALKMLKRIYERLKPGRL